MTPAAIPTAGPWKACPSVEGDQFAVYPDTGKMEFPVAVKPQFAGSDIWEANARLIAAAPEMRRILEAIVAMQSLRYGDATATHLALSSMCESARATLAKAGAA